MVLDEVVRGPAGALDPLRAVEGETGEGEGFDREPVPAREDLLVEGGRRLRRSRRGIQSVVAALDPLAVDGALAVLRRGEAASG